MSGFFLVRRSALRLDELRPEGFKILVEILARTGGLQKREVPLVFAERHSGESKASLREGGRFARQICRIWLDRVRRWRPALTSRGRLARGSGFAAVGLSGLVLNMLLMWAMVESGVPGAHYIVAAAVATQLSSTWNFLWVDWLVYSGPKRLTRLRRWSGAMALSNLVLLLRIPLIALLITVLGVHYLLANALSLVLGTLVRFGGQERLSLPKEIR
jgi:putative flippase GtrA